MELTENIKRLADPADLKQFGKRGETAAQTERRVQYRQEVQLHKEIISFLRRYGLEFDYPPHHKKSGRKIGDPDFKIFGRTAKTIFMECKIDKNGLSKEQFDTRERLINLGFRYYVVGSYFEATSLIKSEFGIR
jgi:hypothetical protein